MNTLRTIDELSKQLLGKAVEALTATEKRVLQSIYKREIISEDIGAAIEDDSSFGERLSDRVAAIGGSWGFITAFGVVLFGWMLLNSEILKAPGEAFDPYPYIFLNLMLSTLAAIQAPIIMMSQNRQSAKDREAAAHDYEVNLRNELEIMRLHEKMNRMLDEIQTLKKR